MVQEALTLPTKFAFYKRLESDPKMQALEKDISQLHATHATVDEYGYANLTEMGLEQLKKLKKMKQLKKLKYPSATDPDFIEFSKEAMKRFYKIAHEVDLPKAIKENPTSYLASVYSLSVGVGALKGWVAREAVVPESEARMWEAMREERNFIAHGDIFRQMNGINLAHSQVHLLADHLEGCGALDFT